MLRTPRGSTSRSFASRSTPRSMSTSGGPRIASSPPRGPRASARAAKEAKGAASARDGANREWTKAKGTAEAAAIAHEERARTEARLGAIRLELDEALGPFSGEMPDLAGIAAEAGRARELDREISALLAETKHGQQAAKDLEAIDRKLAELDRRLGGLAHEADGLAF